MYLKKEPTAPEKKAVSCFPDRKDLADQNTDRLKIPMKIHLLMQDSVYPDGTITMLFEEYDVMSYVQTQKPWSNHAKVPKEIRLNGCKIPDRFVQLTIVVRGLFF